MRHAFWGLKKAGLISLSWDHVHFMCCFFLVVFFGLFGGKIARKSVFLVLRWEGKKFNSSPYVGTWHRFGVHVRHLLGVQSSKFKVTSKKDATCIPQGAIWGYACFKGVWHAWNDVRCRFGHEDVGMVVLVSRQSIKKTREDYIEFEADQRKICHHLHVSPIFEFDSSRYSQRCWAHSSLWLNLHFGSRTAQGFGEEALFWDNDVLVLPRGCHLCRLLRVMAFIQLGRDTAMIMVWLILMSGLWLVKSLD